MATSPSLVARSIGLLALEASRAQLDRMLPTGRSMPKKAGEITPLWLENTMGLNPGVINSVAIVDENSGTASRALLALETADISVPRTIFVKLPPRDFRQQLLMNLMDLGTREVAFYRLVAMDVPIRIPACFGTSVDSLRGRNAILLENLVDARFRDVRDSCDEAEAKAVVDALADLHSTFWESVRFSGDLAGYKGRSTTVTSLGDALAGRILANLKGQAADIVPAEIQRKSRILLDRRKVDSFWAGEPQTVIHGDTHLGNIFFEGTSPGFLDWQVSTMGVGIRDVAYFLVSSLEPSLARTIERGLVDRYAARLGSKGIDVDKDRLWLLYRAVVSEFYVSAVCTSEMTDRMQSQEIARAGVERAAAASSALGTFDILDELVSGSQRYP